MIIAALASLGNCWSDASLLRDRAKPFKTHAREIVLKKSTCWWILHVFFSSLSLEVETSTDCCRRPQFTLATGAFCGRDAAVVTLSPLVSVIARFPKESPSNHTDHLVLPPPADDLLHLGMKARMFLCKQSSQREKKEREQQTNPAPPWIMQSTLPPIHPASF